MKSLKILLVIFLSFISFSLNVDAVICDKEDIARLKELAGHIAVSYESLEEEGIYNSYNVFISGLNEELYLVGDNGNYYYYTDVKDGLINVVLTLENKEFKVYSNRCPDILIDRINFKLSKINLFSLRDECKKLEDYDLKICSRDYEGEITEEYFYKVVNSYLDNGNDSSSIFSKITNFIGNYYMIIIGVVLLVIIIVFIFIRFRRRSVLE